MRLAKIALRENISVYLLYLYIVSLLFYYNLGHVLGIKISTSNIILVLIIINIATSIVRKGIGYIVKDHSLYIFFLFLLWCFAIAPLSLNPAAHLKKTLSLLGAFLLYFSIIQIIRKKSVLINSLYFLYLVIIIASFIGIFQALTYLIWGTAWAGLSVNVAKKFIFPSVSSLFSHHLTFGLFIISGIPSITLYSFVRSNKYLKLNIIRVFLIFSLIGLFLSFSRSAWIAFVVSMLLITIIYLFKRVYLLDVKPEKKIALIMGLGMLVSSLFLIFSNPILSLWQLLIDMNPGSVYARFISWQCAIDCIKHNPIFGIGFESLLVRNPLKINVHNIFLEVLSSTGIVGGGLFMVFLLLIIFKGIIVYFRKNTEEDFSVILLGLVSNVLALLITASFMSALTPRLLWISLGFLTSACNIAKYEKF